MKYLVWNQRGPRCRGGISITAIATICFLLSYFIIAASDCLAAYKHEQSDREQSQEEEPFDFTSLSLEELKQVMIISILKKPQKLSEAASAISVITQDDIRRSGATTIPELLRGLPGMQVAQINSSTWAVSARGFNHRFANKLLVLMDGRCLYTPSFSGVYWNVQDTLFEDIDRIEVIRGPGATLWGANAVNGVINIITKKAKDTQGGLHIVGGGVEEMGFGAFRYGVKLSDAAYSRIYLKYSMKDGSVDNEGKAGNDSWNSLRGGGRLDYSISSSDSLTLQGDIYSGRNGEREAVVFFRPWAGEKKVNVDIAGINIDNDFSGGNVLGRFSHLFSATSNMAIQVYYDRAKQCKQRICGPNHTESFDTFDLDFQHNFQFSKRQEIVWGLGYRLIKEHLSFGGGDKPIFAAQDEHYHTHTVSAFIQDDIDLVRDRVQLTIGSKFEHSDYSEFQFQPGVKMLYKILDNQNIWASISRSIRTPSLYERQAPAPAPPPPPSAVNSSSPSGKPSSSSSDQPPTPVIPLPQEDRHLRPEELIAYELGYRIQPMEYFSLDSALFYNQYNHLIINWDNSGQGKTYGLELAANLDLSRWWSVRASYTAMRMQINVDDSQPGGKKHDFMPDDLSTAFLVGTSPDHQLVLNSSLDFLQHGEFDLELRSVDSLKNNTESYLEADARLGWNIGKNLELSIIGRSLLNSHHAEFVYMGYIPDSGGINMEVERSIFGKITCRF